MPDFATLLQQYDDLLVQGIQATIDGDYPTDELIRRLEVLRMLSGAISGGGGSGITQSQVQAAIIAAIGSRIGSNGDAASVTGSESAQLRAIGERLPTVITSYAHSSASVSTGGSTIVSANASRKHLLIINTSVVPAYAYLSSSVGASGGIPLNPATSAGLTGGFYEISVNNANFYRGAISANTTSGTASLTIVEGV